MTLNAAGDAVARAWTQLPIAAPAVELDAFVIMPNHVHGIVWLAQPDVHDDRGAASGAPTPGTATVAIHQRRPPTLGEVVRMFKSLSARDANMALRRSGALWQRGFYDRVIRGRDELDRIRHYILDNPLRWPYDHENPEPR
jgi:REP element-mobilizing transposase RayT